MSAGLRIFATLATVWLAQSQFTPSTYGFRGSNGNNGQQIQQPQQQQQNPYASLAYGDYRLQSQSRTDNINVNGNLDRSLQQQPPQDGRNFGGPGQFDSNTQGQQNRGLFNSALTPYNTTTNARSRLSTDAVTIQFQLRGFGNPSSALPNGNTCTCPPGHSCPYLKTSPRCYISFTFIISCPDESVRYLATDFVYLDQNGQLPMTSQNSWGQNYVVQLPSKPSAIDVFAHHLGSVIDQQNGNLVADDTLTHVDTFVVPLLDTLPAVDGVQNMNQQKTYQGKLLGTSLTISYSISCLGNMIGPACDLTCTPSTINSNAAACRANSTGFFSICNFISGGQVDNCKNCPWGIKEGTYCQDEHGSVLDPHTAGVVGTSYKTATIILSIVVVVLLGLCLLSIIIGCMQRRNQKATKEMTTFVRSNEDRQPLQASYRSQESAPSVPPRQAMMPPSSDVRPIKSALRKPNYSPLNDTRDTSFSSEVPVRPSRDAVV